MKDVFRKLAEWLGIEKDASSTIEEKVNNDEHPIHPDVHVRTRTVYPKGAKGGGEFRFPVIPDERISKERPPRSNQDPKLKRSTHNLYKPMEAPRAPVEHIKPNSTEATSRKKFQPSEIISPVYGRMSFADPPKEKPTSNMDLHTNEETDDAKWKSISPPEVKVTIDNPSDGEDITSQSRLVREYQNKPAFVPSQPDDSQIDQSFPDVSHLDQSQLNELDKPYVLHPDQSNRDHSRKDDPVNSHDQPLSSNVIAFPKRSVPVETKDEDKIGNTNNESKQEEPEHSPTTDANVGSKTAISWEKQDDTYSELYQFPSANLLQMEPQSTSVDDNYIYEQIDKLTLALENFNVKAEVIGVVKGPTVTRYELQPAPGVKVNKFTNLIDDIKLALAAKDIRMEAPIPGRSAIGIEVPNEVSTPVFIRSILESDEFREKSSSLSVALGRDISGAPVIGDLKKMPHGLIAGATGSGKSVCINSIIVSLMYKAKPSDVRMILIDPKVVELAPYNHIPHLLTPVVTDPKQATAALKWAVVEMDKRYEKFAESGARDIERYNSMMEHEGNEKLPYIVIVIDELADLMMVSPHDVEEAICRIAQKARACGIHLLVATQRPSVDVITGLIKANIPSRIAFSVSSQADSRTILDMGGAERLLGKGDMLYYPSGQAKPVRLQGNFVSDDEIEQVVEHVKKQQKTVYLFDKEELNRVTSASSSEQDDELFEEALLFTIEQGQASASSLQRRFRIGYNRAARLIDLMEAEGYVSGQSGSKPREVLITMDDYYNLFG
ncbi:S-DNA-T family DNA segregation ATPase FtsK/SpoIIIE [Ammoniphilus resinae]|uniref:S-DNA-T family DNA segregation ATPase FtsK/SpoIIIE n=1 Tax=Ammoniphilus resinae TaxID=861532 RepID=A0ABS4GXR9_9BACL|nr:DNA translocase FtsK [Ammoniphilus resinae]MBP1935071.1 S-DNA-T family DNA segregation ATPase FtsK/SpoIIIE [Ammoniphilus resinae]